jgi:hypothetical protein
MVSTVLVGLPLHLDDARIGGRLGHLARRQVVAQVAGGDVDHVAFAAELLDVLKQDRLLCLTCHVFPYCLGRP